jgi:hypothetical protein
VIESVDADDDLDTLISIFQLADTFLDFWLRQGLCEFLGVNADNELVYTD